MDRQRSAEWAVRVAAWHNRHPLARRLLPEQVHTPGWVQLPFASQADPAGGRKRWRALFTEKFLKGIGPRRIARWALRHGQESHPADSALPLRLVAADPRRTGDGASAVPQAALWVASVALTAGKAQTRVLLDSGRTPAVLGRRLWSAPRCAAFALVLATAAGLPALLHSQPGLGAAVAGRVGAVAAGIGSALHTDDSAEQGTVIAVIDAHGADAAVAALPQEAAPQMAEPDPAAADAPAGAFAEVDAGDPAVAATEAHDEPAHPAAAAQAEATTPLPGSPEHSVPKPDAAAFQVQSLRRPAAPVGPVAGTLRPSAQPIRKGTVSLPLRPALDDAAKELARETSAAARAERSGIAPPEPGMAAAAAAVADAAVANTASTSAAAFTAGQPAPANAARAGASAGAAAGGGAGGGKRPAAEPAAAYALATPLLRSQAEAELKQAILRSALARSGAAVGVRVEMLPSGDDWRVVCWPIDSRDRAEQLRGVLAARGQRSIEVVAF